MPGHLAASSIPTKRTRFFYGYIIVAAGFIIIALMWGTAQSFGVFLKPMSEELGWTRAMTSAAFSIFMVSVGLIYMLTGKLTDRFGPRIVISVCGLLFGLGHILMSYVSALWQLYVLYGIVIAIGTSGSFVPMASTVARWFVKRRGLMTGITVSGIGAGTMIGPPAIGWLITGYGWRTSYLITGLATLALLTLASQFLKHNPREIGLLPYGESVTNLDSLASTKSGFSVRGATRTRQFWLLCAGYFACGISPWSVTVHIVPFATDLGIPTLAATNILTIVGALNIVGRIVIGNLGDRIGYKPALILSFTLMLTAIFSLQLAKELWVFYAFAAVFGLGWGGAGTTMSPIVADLFGLRAHGLLLAITNFSWLTGGSVGSYATGYLFDVSRSYYVAYLASAIFIAGGITLASFLKPTDRQKLSEAK